MVGRFSRAFEPLGSVQQASARVAAILVRRREDEGAAFQNSAKCDRWEVVVPELQFDGTAREVHELA
jgi:hypothetical protein